MEERELVEVPMVFDAAKWEIIANAKTKWDPFDLIGEMLDAAIDAVAAAVEDEESEPPALDMLTG